MERETSVGTIETSMMQGSSTDTGGGTDTGSSTAAGRAVRQRGDVMLVLLLVLAAGWLPWPAFAQAVWKVSDGDSYIYLGGTVHLLRPSDFPLPDAYQQAYDDSERIYLETDLAAMTDMAVQQRMLRQLTYGDGRTLRSVLDEDVYQELTQYVENISGLPMVMMDSFRPGLLVSTLSVLEFQRMGFTPEGVDAHFYARAVEDGKPVGELETVDEQLAVLASMGEGYENEFIRYSLQDIDNIADSIENLVHVWRSGDERQLESDFVTPVQEQSRSLYDSLLADRNHTWMTRIEAMFNEPGTDYVLVGAAHMVGEDGLLSLLRERGYQVSQL